MRLSTDIWLSALIRRAERAGAYATVIRKGDARGGAVLVKVADRRAGMFRLYGETITETGDRLWIQPVNSIEEADLDAYAARAGRIDPDIWVVEIDDVQGRHFLTEAVEKS